MVVLPRTANLNFRLRVSVAASAALLIDAWYLRLSVLA